MKKKSFLSVTGFSHVKYYKFIYDIIALIDKYQCNIENSQSSEFKNDFLFYTYVSGAWNKIYSLEKEIQQLISLNNNELFVICKRIDENNQKQEERESFIPYVLKLTTIDEGGILHKVVSFCDFQEIDVSNINTYRYTNEYGYEMINLKIVLKVPFNLNISSLREQLQIFCDNENLDASLDICSF